MDNPFEGAPEDLAAQEDLAVLNENPEAVSPAVSGEDAMASGRPDVGTSIGQEVDEGFNPNDPYAIPKEWQDALIKLVDD